MRQVLRVYKQDSLQLIQGTLRISAGSTTASQSKSLHDSVLGDHKGDGMGHSDIPITDVLDLIDYLTTTITDTEEKPSPVLPCFPSYNDGHAPCPCNRTPEMTALVLSMLEQAS
jgi:hypothetical protein